jgi:hypothetical protein
MNGRKDLNPSCPHHQSGEFKGASCVVHVKSLTDEELKAIGIESLVVAKNLVMNSARLQMPHREPEAATLRAKAFDAIAELKPDGVMLPVQMIGTYNAGVESLSRATHQISRSMVSTPMLREPYARFSLQRTVRSHAETQGNTASRRSS